MPLLILHAAIRHSLLMPRLYSHGTRVSLCRSIHLHTTAIEGPSDFLVWLIPTPCRKRARASPSPAIHHHASPTIPLFGHQLPSTSYCTQHLRVSERPHLSSLNVTPRPAPELRSGYLNARARPRPKTQPLDHRSLVACGSSAIAPDGCGGED